MQKVTSRCCERERQSEREWDASMYSFTDEREWKETDDADAFSEWSD